jgi:hypothetical protein
VDVYNRINSIMDYDIYSANDQIGRVYIDINGLIDSAYSSCTMKGTSASNTAAPSAADNHPIVHKDSRLSESEDSNDELAGGISIATASSAMYSAEMNGWLPILDTLSGLLLHVQ